MRILRLLLLITIITMSQISKAEESDRRTLTVIGTTDVHGDFLPYDFIGRRPASGSLARVATYIDSMRAERGRDNVIVLDAGDILQGQPTAYYYDFVDTVSTHIANDIYRYIGYDAITIGNHDIETGHAVYDRWIRNSSAPVLGANIIDTRTGRPYLKPYTIIDRGGVKVAVLGLLTPAIPAWLPENLWSNLRFDDMVSSARYWADYLRKHEKPDVMIGLFHSGRDYKHTTDGILENASLLVAREVPEFDLILFGHDHKRFIDKEGKTLLLNPANNAQSVAVAEITLGRHTPEDAYAVTSVEGRLQDVTALRPSAAYMAEFRRQGEQVKEFVSRHVGNCTETISTRDALFGPSAFMQLIHDLQLSISGADISIAAPLSFDARIAKGPMRVSDMFTLYKYENMLYTMRLSGREIKDYLEMSYGLWTAEPETDGKPSQHLLRFESAVPTPNDNRLANPIYNLDSAYGINYTVDITKPRGSKITITGMADGRPFEPDSMYTVALNSYRGNGGGDHLTRGAGIPREELRSRIVRATDHDLRYYLMKEIEQLGTVHPHIDPNWRFVPERQAAALGATDRTILFSPASSPTQK